MAISLNDNIKILANKPTDPRSYHPDNRPWVSVTEAHTLMEFKTLGIPIYIDDGNGGVDEYHYKSSTANESDLILKQPNITIEDGIVTLKGQWNASSGTFPTDLNTTPSNTDIKAGHSFICTSAATIDGVEFNPEDSATALIDNPSQSTYLGNWHKTDNTDRVVQIADIPGLQQTLDDKMEDIEPGLLTLTPIMNGANIEGHKAIIDVGDSKDGVFWIDDLPSSDLGLLELEIIPKNYRFFALVTLIIKTDFTVNRKIKAYHNPSSGLLWDEIARHRYDGFHESNLIAQTEILDGGNPVDQIMRFQIGVWSYDVNGVTTTDIEIIKKVGRRLDGQ